MEYVHGTMAPIYKRRWWLRVRECQPFSGGWAVYEFYCPIWAVWLDKLHGLIFGKVILKN